MWVQTNACVTLLHIRSILFVLGMYICIFFPKLLFKLIMQPNTDIVAQLLLGDIKTAKQYYPSGYCYVYPETGSEHRGGP